jgi:hypothetical protein
VATMPPTPPGGPPAQPPGGGPPAQYPPAYQPHPGQYPQPYPGQYPQTYPGQAYPYGARMPFKRNPMLLVVQVLAILQGILLVLAAAGFVLLGLVANGVFSGVNLHNVNGYNFAGAAFGVFIGVGVVLLILGVLVIIGGVRVGHPSQVARWLLAVFEILLLLGTLSGFSTTGRAAVSSIVALVIEAIILYGLVIDPATYRAFGRKNLP